MGLFKKLFSGKNSENNSQMEWYPLQDLLQIDDIITNSFEKVVIIFKHSTRCSISRFVLQNFEEQYNFTKEQIIPYYLDLLSYREISNEVAVRLGINHQSPQLIVIKNGKVIFDASHESIDPAVLNKFI